MTQTPPGVKMPKDMPEWMEKSQGILPEGITAAPTVGVSTGSALSPPTGPDTYPNEADQDETFPSEKISNKP